jgi:TolB protein
MRLLLTVAAALALFPAGAGAGSGARHGEFAYSTRAGDIWVVDPDGSHRHRITHSGGGFDFKPTWSPDGSRIAFQTTRGTPPPAGETNVFVVDVDGSHERQLTLPRRFRYGGASPDWSPDGKLISFASEHGLAVESPNGGPVRLLGVAGDSPTWSPDGRRLVYAARTESGHAVFAVNRDGSGNRRLTQEAGDAFPGAWSPDGKRLAYIVLHAGAGHVYVTDRTGRNSRQITRGPGTQFPAAWLEDGRLLVGISASPRATPHWVLMRADGSNAEPLPQLDGAVTVAWHC